MSKYNFSVARFEPHINLNDVGLEGQKKISAAKVLVVGAGGLGSPLLYYLTAAGVGTIGIVDGDDVWYSNLQRQILFVNKDIKKNKAVAAKERLELLSDRQAIMPYNCMIDEDNARSIIEGYDFVVDATDNFGARYLINKVCYSLNKPWVFAAVSKYEGQLSVFHNGNLRQACFSCIFPSEKENFNERTCEGEGILSPITGIMGSIQAFECLKLILGNHESLNQLLVFDFYRHKSRTLYIEKNKHCRVCNA